MFCPHSAPRDSRCHSPGRLTTRPDAKAAAPDNSKPKEATRLHAHDSTRHLTLHRNARRRRYTEADLAGDLGLDGEDQLPPDAVTAYLDAADQTFWHETERIAREHLDATAGARARGNREGAGPVSAPAPRPAPHEGVLRQAADLERRHGKAAVYWQIGDSGSDAAQRFYRVLLAGIAGADPEIMSLYQMPGLTAQQDYDRDNLAADLGLARDDPALAAAAEAYLAAAREEFWLEAARLARLRLRPGRDHTAGGAGQLTAEPGPVAAEAPAGGQDGAEAEGTDLPQDITDPATGLSRLLSERCSTCILRPGDKMHLGPEQTAAFVRQRTGRRDVRGLPPDFDVRGQPGLRPGDLPGLFQCLRRPLAGAAPAARLRPPDRGRPAPAGRTRQRGGPVTRAEAAEQLRTLATVAVRNLAAPAVIRPRRDGWLIFIPAPGYAWYGTAEAAADALLAGSTRSRRPASHCAHQAPAAQRPAAQRAVYREPSVQAGPHALPGNPAQPRGELMRRGPVDPPAVAAGTPADPSAPPEPPATPPG